MSGTRELMPPAGVASPGGRPAGSELLLSADEIQRRVRELGAEISRDYQEQTPLLVNILKGGFFFLADLMRAITVPHQVDFMAVSTYDQGTISSGVVRILSDLTINIQGRDVLIVEDIVDTGLTLSYIREMLMGRHPTSLRICTLLLKDRHQPHPVPPIDYVGFEIPDRFVVGYGLDADEFYRNLPDLVILPETT